MENNVECLNEDLVRDLNVQLILMSPPCQPFTRIGLQKDDKDNRTSALQHILNILPKLKTIEFIILENVVGFETSNTRNQLLGVLNFSGFRYQEFILSPCQLNIPNSRTRYYLLAKRGEFPFEREDKILYELPNLDDSNYLSLINKFKADSIIGDILEEGGEKLSDKVLQKYATIFDIVTKDSNRSCCFTKGYSHYVEGTGSIFCPMTLKDVKSVYEQISYLDKNSKEYLKTLQSLQLRYFSPNEVSKLMTFPPNFQFPLKLTNKQKYRLLGNSLNVHVVSILINLLIL